MRRPTGELSRAKRILFRTVSCGLSFVFAGLVLEVALRIRSGEPFTWKPMLRGPWARLDGDDAVARYDAQLGWLPEAAGRFQNGSRFRIDARGFRLHPGVRPAGPPILALGDSVTFGDEVDDHETWPFHLEAVLARPVSNAGVFGYGVDQAVLRGEGLLELHRPERVVLALIGNDIDRTQYSYNFAWKPYFTLEEQGLVQRNVPVPRGPAPEGAFAAPRRWLSYSHLVDSVFSRLAPHFWLIPSARVEHGDGHEVTAQLLARFAARCSDASLLVVTLGVPARLGGNERIAPLARRLDELGVTVLDLVPPLEARARDDPSLWASFFEPGGHYSSQGNAWIAARIAEHIEQEAAAAP